MQGTFKSLRPVAKYINRRACAASPRCFRAGNRTPMKRRSCPRTAILASVLVLIALTSGPAGAQSGRLGGVVADATGAVLTGVTVTLYGGLGEPGVSMTDSAGRFAFAGLPPGAYRLAAELSGYSPASVDDIVIANEPVEVPVIGLLLVVLSDPLVVTATRTEQPLRDVPMSVSAFIGDDIERRDLEDVAELAHWTPGLTVVDQGARGANVLIVRGLHTDSLNGSGAGDTGVATYMGDVPVEVDLRLSDIERVEVLLGPQGTLYGAGTLAGAVRYLPRRPDTERRTFDLRADLFGLAHGGSVGYDAGLTFNLPLIRTRLALRGAIDRFADPGFIDYDYLLIEPGVSEPEPDLTDPQAVAANLRQEPDANTEETLSVRFSLLWKTSSKWSALLSYHLQDRRAGARQINHASSFGTGRYVSAHRFLEPLDRKDQLASLELNWDLGFVSLTSATGYSWGSTFASSDQTDLLIQEFGIARLLPNNFPELDRARALDPHVSATDLTSRFSTFAAYTQGESERRRLSWEARLVSTGDGPWRWVGGAFFNDARRSGTGRELAPGLTEFSGVTPVLKGRPVSDPVEYYSFSRESVTEHALFGEVSLQLGGWRLSGGGRWFGYDVATGNQTEFPYTPAYNSPYEDFDADDSGFLFKGSVSYRFGGGTNVYFTRSEGYRIGGGNNFRVCTDEEIALLTDDDPENDPPQAGCIYAHQALVKPDRTTNYEIGLRRSWSGDRVVMDASLFHVDWRDIQVAGVTPFSAQGITLNGAGAVSRGVEIAASAGITGALRLRGSWSYTRAALSQDSPGLLGAGADAFKGDRLAGAPRSQGSLFASYGTLLGDDAVLELLYGYSYIGDVLTRIGERSGGERLPSYDLHTITASVSKDAWTVAVYADNLLNEYAVTSARQTPAQIGRTEEGFTSRRYFANVLTPRRAGVRLRYTFR